MSKIILGKSRAVDVLDAAPGIESMSIEEIAHALAHINRFQGRLSRQVSTAEHNCVQACYVLAHPGKASKEVCARLAYYCLMRDVAAVLIGDINELIKPYIACFELCAIDMAFELRFCVDAGENLEEYAKCLDKVTTAVEAENCGLSDPYWQGIIAKNKRMAHFLASSYQKSCYIKPNFFFYQGQLKGIREHLYDWDTLFVFLYNYLCKELDLEHS